MEFFKINGRKRYYDHLMNFVKVDKSTYTVERHTITYTIWGGRQAGGSRYDWFVEGPDWKGAIPCDSILDALHMLDTM